MVLKNAKKILKVSKKTLSNKILFYSPTENAIDVTLSDGELSSPTNEGDKTKSIQNILGPNETILPKKDSLLLEGPNTIVVSATVHQPNE